MSLLTYNGCRVSVLNVRMLSRENVLDSAFRCDQKWTLDIDGLCNLGKEKTSDEVHQQLSADGRPLTFAIASEPIIDSLQRNAVERCKVTEIKDSLSVLVSLRIVAITGGVA